MPVQSSGQIKITDIITEFGGSEPHALSEYYRDGGEVGGGSPNVPTSGQLKISDFYGATDVIVETASDNETDRSLSSIFGSNWTSSVPKKYSVPSSVNLGATATNTYAITAESGMGGTLIIEIAGTVTGRGGNGGNGGHYAHSNRDGGNGSGGGAGGDAVYLNTNNVTINVLSGGRLSGGGRGGGGGGGGGAGWYGPQWGGDGGDGGDGQGWNTTLNSGQNAGRGTASWQSNGGGGGSGGTYGNNGASGGAGTNTYYPGRRWWRPAGNGGGGGAAGAAVELGSGISYTLNNSGTVDGSS